MKKISLLTVVIAAALVAAGCDQPPATPPAAPAPVVSAPTAEAPATPAAAPSPAAAPTANFGETIATVNGSPISKAELASLTEELAARGMADRVSQSKLLDELIKREVLRQEAIAQHLDSSQETAVRMANIQRALLAHAAGQAYLKANPITDETVKQKYDAEVASNKQTEFKASHILVKTEQEAKDIIKKLQAGNKFDALAKKHSSDTGSADKGGDLGWFSPQQMVGPFSEAVSKLENGKYSTEPVKSDFGWHVILREESREKAPPPFEALKDQLRETLQNASMQKYLDDLQAKAKITRNDTPPPAPAAPANATPPTPPAPAPTPTPAPAEAAPAPAPAAPAAPADGQAH